jgi:hypothetical protein
MVLEPTNVLHDDDRVYTHREGEGGSEALRQT